MEKCNLKAMAIALGVAWGGYMIIIGWTAPYGWGEPMVTAISSLYIGFTPGWIGGLIGGVWGFIDGAIGGLIIAYVYNLVAKNENKNHSDNSG